METASLNKVSACLSEVSCFLTSASMLLPADLLLEAGALRFGLAGRFLELALTLEASFLEAVGGLFLASAFLGIGGFQTITLQQKREILQGDFAIGLGCIACHLI